MRRTLGHSETPRKGGQKAGGGINPPTPGLDSSPTQPHCGSSCSTRLALGGRRRGGDVVGDTAWRDAGQGAGRGWGAAPSAAKGKFQPEGQVSLPQKRGQLSPRSAALESVTSRDKECVPKELETSQGTEEPLNLPQPYPKFPLSRLKKRMSRNFPKQGGGKLRDQSCSEQQDGGGSINGTFVRKKGAFGEGLGGFCYRVVQQTQARAAFQRGLNETFPGAARFQARPVSFSTLIQLL